jgi:hypothetical protein
MKHAMFVGGGFAETKSGSPPDLRITLITLKTGET